jgi:DNA polymerase-1
VLFSADTEGCLIMPGMQAPPLVCLQFKVDDGEPQLIHVKDPACRRAIEYALEHCLWDFHNAPHDLACMMAQWPDLTERIFGLFDRDGITCTIVRQKLIDIARGYFKSRSKRGYALDAVASALGISQVINKEDPWRLRYGELIDVPVSQWPPEAVQYALGDCTAQHAVYQAQEAYAAKHGVPLVDQFRQARAAMWLKLIECRGIMVDPRRVEEYIANVRETRGVDRKICEDEGLLRDGKRWMEAAQKRMAAVCAESQEADLPITDTGEKFMREWLGIRDPKIPLPIGATWKAFQQFGCGKKGLAICLDEDSCKQFGDETLEAFQRYGTGTTQIARAERLYLAARLGVPIQPRFGSLQDSGRTSCSQGDTKKAGPPSAFGAQTQNPAKDKPVQRKDGSTFVRKGTRDCFVPRSGYAFISTDWEGAEASGVAQVCHELFGFSRMADVINAGGNLPTEFGAMIAGIPKEDAYALRKAGGARKKAFDGGPRQSAKIALYGYFGGMGPAKLKLQARKLYGVHMTEAEARDLREKLFVFAPEIKLLHRWGGDTLRKAGGETADYTHPISGRVRGKCWYSALLNGTFQGRVADVFKDAGWRITREMFTVRSSPLYGCRIVNECHDDILSEVPLDGIHEAGFRQAKIMEQTWNEWCPDVVCRCSPAAMLRMYKDAETVLNSSGRLICWEPS